MALPVFVFSTVGRGLWNEISKELLTTPKPITGSLMTRAQIFITILETNNQNIINMLHDTRDVHS
jgi:hypothetical protein